MGNLTEHLQAIFAACLCGTPQSSLMFEGNAFCKPEDHGQKIIQKIIPDHHSMLGQDLSSKNFNVIDVIAWSRFVLELQCSHHQLVGPPM